MKKTKKGVSTYTKRFTTTVPDSAFHELNCAANLLGLSVMEIVRKCIVESSYIQQYRAGTLEPCTAAKLALQSGMYKDDLYVADEECSEE